MEEEEEVEEKCAEEVLYGQGEETFPYGREAPVYMATGHRLVSFRGVIWTGQGDRARRRRRLFH